MNDTIIFIVAIAALFAPAMLCYGLYTGYTVATRLHSHITRMYTQENQAMAISHKLITVTFANPVEMFAGFMRAHGLANTSKDTLAAYFGGTWNNTNPVFKTLVNFTVYAQGKQATDSAYFAALDYLSGQYSKGQFDKNADSGKWGMYAYLDTKSHSADFDALLRGNNPVKSTLANAGKAKAQANNTPANKPAPATGKVITPFAPVPQGKPESLNIAGATFTFKQERADSALVYHCDSGKMSSELMLALKDSEVPGLGTILPDFPHNANIAIRPFKTHKTPAIAPAAQDAPAMAESSDLAQRVTNLESGINSILAALQGMQQNPPAKKTRKA